MQCNKVLPQQLLTGRRTIWKKANLKKGMPVFIGVAAVWMGTHWPGRRERHPAEPVLRHSLACPASLSPSSPWHFWATLYCSIGVFPPVSRI